MIEVPTVKLVYSYPSDDFEPVISEIDNLSLLLPDAKEWIITHDRNEIPIQILVYEEGENTMPMHGYALDLNRIRVTTPDYTKSYKVVIVI